MSSDVLIIGGGIIGLAIARELRARGLRRVTIVDRGELGAEASWAAAGMLAPNIEAGGSSVFHRFCRESLDLYPEFADALFTETGIDIQLDRTGTLCVAFTEKELGELEKHDTAQTERLSGDDIRQLEPMVSDAVLAGVRFPGDWQVDNRKLIAALRGSLEKNDVEIFEHSAVTELLIEGDRVLGAVTGSGPLPAETTVLATGAWTSLIKFRDSALPFKVKPVRGQMASFADVSRPRHVIFSARGYLVPRADGRLLVGATVEDVGFENVTTDEGIESLHRAAVEIVPALANLPFTDSWSGLRPFVEDGLPVIGGVPGVEGLSVATAHYRNGILLAPRTAQVIADAIVNKTESEFFRPFGVERFGSHVVNAAAKS